MRLPRNHREFLDHIGIPDGYEMSSPAQLEEARCRVDTLTRLLAESLHKDLYSRDRDDVELAMFIYETAAEKWDFFDELMMAFDEVEKILARKSRAVFHDHSATAATEATESESKKWLN